MYRLCYDNLFIAPNKKIMYEESEYCANILLTFEFSFIKYGKEIQMCEVDEQKKTIVVKQPETGVFFCIDKKKGYKEFCNRLSNESLIVKWKPLSTATIWNSEGMPISISLKEAQKLLIDNYDIYNTSYNRPVQTNGLRLNRRD